MELASSVLLTLGMFVCLFPYRPASMDELRKVLAIANKYALPLWTISRGKNLGYDTDLCTVDKVFPPLMKVLNM